MKIVQFKITKAWKLQRCRHAFYLKHIRI